MSPRKITRLSLYISAVSLVGAVVMLLWRPDIGIFKWWPAGGILLSLGLIGWALFRGWTLSVQKRMAMSDAINLCYLGEQERVEGQSQTSGHRIKHR